MVSANTRVAIAPQQHEDELDAATAELHEYLEQSAEAIAPEPDFTFVHTAHRQHALDIARAFNQSQLEKLQTELTQGKRLLEAKEMLTRRGEFTGFRNSLSVTLAEAKKYMQLASTFGDWAIEKLMVIASATNIYTLCQNKYVSILEDLRSASGVTKEFVQRLLNEVRGKAAAERKKNKEKAQDAPNNNGDVLRQHVDGDSGTSYYTLSEANLSEKVGSALAEQLKERSLGQILAQALEPSPDKHEVERLQKQIVEAVSEMRNVQIEMQRELIQRDRRIEELESLLAKTAPTSIEKPESAAVSQLIWAKQEQLIVDFLEHSCGDIFTVWLPNVEETEVVSAAGMAKFLQSIDDF